MYERSAIVLERYIESLLGFNKQNNLDTIYGIYKKMVEEMINYQNMLLEEEEVIKKFEEVATKLQNMQQDQKNIYNANVELEESRHMLFNEFDINPETLEKKLTRIEGKIDQNNEELKEIRNNYVTVLNEFMERQKERNNCARKKKKVDVNHISVIKETESQFEMISKDVLKNAKIFIEADKNKIKKEILEAMIKNGKSERVPFDESIIESAIEVRVDIAVKEAQCYVLTYERLRKLLNEVDNDNILLARFEKTLRDVSVKMRFLEAEKEYIICYLDNERMSAVNGKIIHKKMMKEAYKNFEADIDQINKLYELIMREIANKATKKAYNELYNNTYLKNIEKKEKNFEEEIINVKIQMGTVINSNYWRIDGIKNIYTVFKEEVVQKFDRDLSDYEEEDYQEITIDNYEDNNIEEYEEEYEDYEDDEGYEDEEDLEDDYEEEFEDDEFDDEEELEEEEDYEEEYEDDDEYDYEEEYEDEFEDEFEEEEDVIEKKPKTTKAKKSKAKESVFEIEIEEPLKTEKIHKEEIPTTSCRRIIRRKPKQKVETNEIEKSNKKSVRANNKTKAEGNKKEVEKIKKEIEKSKKTKKQVQKVNNEKIDRIMQNSRNKITENLEKKENNGIFNKIFKK